MHRSLKLTAAGLLAGAVVAGTAAPALAYDCYNASRSARGNAGAAHSSTWYSVPEFLAVVGFSPEQIASVLPVIAADPRVPAGFTVFFNDRHDMELAQKMREDLAVNGRGIDHSDDYSTPVFAAIFEDVMSVLAG